MKYFIFTLSIFLLWSCSKDDSSTILAEPVIVRTHDFSKTMGENPASGYVLGSVVGTTNKGGITFTFTEQTPEGALSVDAQSGELRVNNENLFNFEVNPVITGTIKVANGEVFENANVTINLMNVDEALVYSGTIELMTQEEVNIFGANNYTHISGRLQIGLTTSPNNSITDLSPLASLTTIGGSLYLSSNNSLTDLNGLQNIESVGGYVRILHHELLSTIQALSQIERINTDLWIYDNNQLTSLLGLENIIHLGYLSVNDNLALENLNELSNVRTLENYMNISGNSSLTNLNGLSNITSVSGYLTIYNNSSLTNLDGLSSLISIDGPLSIAENNALISINGLNNLTSVNGVLNFESNQSLISLEGLENLTSVVERINIYENASLINIDALSQVPGVLETIFIFENSSLTNLDGLSMISSVPNLLFVVSNPLLTDLCGLQTLFIGGAPNATYTVGGNGYNPSKQDIIDGNCSL